MLSLLVVPSSALLRSLALLPAFSYSMIFATPSSMPNTPTARPKAILRVRVSRDSNSVFCGTCTSTPLMSTWLHCPRRSGILISGYKVSYTFESLGLALMLLGCVFSRFLLHVPTYAVHSHMTPQIICPSCTLGLCDNRYVCGFGSFWVMPISWSLKSFYADSNAEHVLARSRGIGGDYRPL